MKFKIAQPIDYNPSEKELQEFIEKNLSYLNDWGLQYVASYVPIGTGIIDILAVDDEDNPVILECKKIGKKFDKNAVFQLMEYYSWFVRDPNHIHILHRLIHKKYPDKNDLEEVPILIAIVGSVEDDVKNACWAIHTDIMLIKLSLIKDANGDIIVNPEVVLDTSIEGQRVIREPKTEEEHFKGKEHMKPLYEELIKRLKLELDQKIKINPTPQGYIGISNRITFCCVYVKKQWLRLELLLKPEEGDEDSGIISYAGAWSYIHLKDINELDDKKLTWIKKAYLNAA